MASTIISIQTEASHQISAMDNTFQAAQAVQAVVSSQANVTAAHNQ